MTLQILEDARERPELFCWAGALNFEQLSGWSSRNSLVLVPELFHLLSVTGGGDMFETETILMPFSGQQTGDNAEEANAFHRQQGLPKHLWLFHVGIVLSAVDKRDARVVTVSEHYGIRGEYPSLDHWYVTVIRDEYAGRYGLARSELKPG